MTPDKLTFNVNEGNESRNFIPFSEPQLDNLQIDSTGNITGHADKSVGASFRVSSVSGLYTGGIYLYLGDVDKTYEVTRLSSFSADYTCPIIGGAGHIYRVTTCRSGCSGPGVTNGTLNVGSGDTGCDD